MSEVPLLVAIVLFAVAVFAYGKSRYYVGKRDGLLEAMQIIDEPHETTGERCQDCGKRYLTVYWLPDAVWRAITPKPDYPEGGLLCPPCADRRAREQGIELVWGASRDTGA